MAVGGGGKSWQRYLPRGAQHRTFQVPYAHCDVERPRGHITLVSWQSAEVPVNSHVAKCHSPAS
eukprot:7384838-Alexandrium_andersonii.AAC.1